MLNKLNLLFAFGRPFSPFYSAAMKAREKLYHSGTFKTHSLPVPVISIGNLVLGGTGKTPTVRYVAKLLSDIGMSPAIISRGYGGSAKNIVNIVSDGRQLLLSPDVSGDEPFMLAQMLPNLPVITGSKRINPCKYAVEQLGADIIILDDGFQHMAVSRDINLVLFDATALAGNSRIFPGGPLREPVSALARCDALIITGTMQENLTRASKFGEILRDKFPEKPIFYSSYGPSKILSSKGEEQPETLTKNRFFAFCGIANPQRFAKSLEAGNIDMAGLLTRPDHAIYSSQDVIKLNKLARVNDATAFITTFKDFVKLSQYSFDLPVYIFDPGYSMDENFKPFLMNKLETG